MKLNSLSTICQFLASELRPQRSKGFRTAFLAPDEIEDDCMGVQSRPDNEEFHDRGIFNF